MLRAVAHTTRCGCICLLFWTVSRATEPIFNIILNQENTRGVCEILHIFVYLWLSGWLGMKRIVCFVRFLQFPSQACCGCVAILSLVIRSSWDFCLIFGWLPLFLNSLTMFYFLCCSWPYCLLSLSAQVFFPISLLSFLVEFCVAFSPITFLSGAQPLRIKWAGVEFIKCSPVFPAEVIANFSPFLCGSTLATTFCTTMWQIDLRPSSDSSRHGCAHTVFHRILILLPALF